MPQSKHSAIGRLLPVDSAGGPVLPCLPASELALLTAQATGDAAPLAAVLATDPALTLWALILARGTDQPLSIVDGCAVWLASADGIEQCRAAVAAIQPGNRTVGRKTVKRWRRLVRQGVNTASLAEAVAASQPDSRAQNGQRAYLLGLVHNAADWLAVDAAAISSKQLAQWLPLWLLQAIEGLSAAVNEQASASTDPAVAAVALALRGEIADNQALRAARRHAADAARAWRPWNLQGTLSLPHLLAKASAQASLESPAAVSDEPLSICPLSPELEREKLEALAEFAAGAGHEINNPLAVISGRAQLMMQSETSPERRRDAALIHAQAQRVHEMIADLMFYARPPQPQPEVFDLGAALEQLLAELAAHPGAEGVALRAEAPAQPVQVRADRSQLLAAVRAICLNSLFALSGRGEVRLSWSQQGGEVLVAVADTGPGISPEVRRHLFDPYFSGRESGRGLGVGLAKAWRIVTMHGGTIEVETHPGQGTAMTIHLPAGEEQR